MVYVQSRWQLDEEDFRSVFFLFFKILLGLSDQGFLFSFFFFKADNRKREKEEEERGERDGGGGGGEEGGREKERKKLELETPA